VIFNPFEREKRNEGEVKLEEKYNDYAERNDETTGYLRAKERQRQEELKRQEIKERQEQKRKEEVEKMKQKRMELEEIQNQTEINFRLEFFVRKKPSVLEDGEYISKIFKPELFSQMLSILESKIFKTHEKYSEQENQALISTENIVLLGRSGTGKTLVALTKIFLLKMCTSLKEMKFFIKKGENPYLRIIFCTTSVNLIEEVSKYYKLMENKFKEAGTKDSKQENKNIAQPLSLENYKVNEYNTFDELKVILNCYFSFNIINFFFLLMKPLFFSPFLFLLIIFFH